LALNESMASGRTVMATRRVGATADLIQPGKTGFLFPEASAKSDLAAQALCDLPNRTELLEMGCYCQRYIGQNWSFEVLVQKIYSLVTELSEQPVTGKQT
ncbi:MAG: hypothetical protein ABGZ35_22240, partial [Planctomycetaceae bacterium]